MMTWTNTSAPTPTPTSTTTRDLNEVLSKMLNSHKSWEQVEGYAELSWFKNDILDEQYKIHFYIDQISYAHIIQESEYGGGIPIEVVLSNGTLYGILNEQHNYFTDSYDENEVANRIANLPEKIEDVGDIFIDWPPRMAHIHAFGSMFLSPIENYIYPQWFTVNYYEANYYIVESTKFLERPVWVVGYELGYEEIFVWVDKETGMILRMEQKEDGSDTYFEMNMIEFKINQPSKKLDLAFLSDFNKIKIPPAPHTCYYGPWCSLGN
jgi:hypothetical protein